MDSTKVYGIVIGHTEYRLQPEGSLLAVDQHTGRSRKVKLGSERYHRVRRMVRGLYELPAVEG